MKKTIRLIGKAIREGSVYSPIRFRAARLAATAKPKDYLGQLNAIYDDFVKRWRYVKDPFDRELVTIEPREIYQTVMGGDNGIGHGDCDDSTVAIGSQLAAIGFPVRIATIAPSGAPPGRLMSHVFPQAYVQGKGWITVDPVVFPERGLGFVPPNSRLVTWNLDGKITNQYGNARGLSGLSGADMKPWQWSMLGDVEQWTDYSGMGETTSLEGIPDFREYFKGFGQYADQMGIMGGLGLAAEVDTDENGLAWTPALELAPHDYEYLRYNKTPYSGMLALGDNGAAYRYDSNLGFFRKLFKRIKKRVSSVAKKVLKKIPGGKYLLRLGEKVWKVAKKFVRPLVKFVGKYATKLAPIAALIPGYGPAISAALLATGRVAKIMQKYGVKLAGKKGEARKLRFPSGNVAKKFQAELTKHAAVARKQKLDTKIKKLGYKKMKKQAKKSRFKIAS